jgi:transcriptional regulator with XRE-family HTH domain
MGRSHRIKPKRLGEKLKLIRNSLGLTLEQMIEQLDYKESKLYPQNVSGFEKSEREPNLLILLAYARLAGVSTDELIDDEMELNSLKQKEN